MLWWRTTRKKKKKTAQQHSGTHEHTEHTSDRQHAQRSHSSQHHTHSRQHTAITEHEGKVHGHGRLQRRLRKPMISSSSAADVQPINCKSNVAPLAVTRTNGPWTHTSGDSYIYQLSLVSATATISAYFPCIVFDPQVLHGPKHNIVCCTPIRDGRGTAHWVEHAQLCLVKE